MLDLSLPIVAGMAVYPGDPDVTSGPALDLVADGVAVTALALGSHTGTHLDAPAHVVPGGRTSGRIALDELLGDAIVVHLPRSSLPSGDRYGLAELDRAITGGLPERLPPIVLIDTGRHDRSSVDRSPDDRSSVERSADDRSSDDRGPEHRGLDPAAATELLRRGMHVLALDAESPDTAGSLAVHEIVLGADGLIVENLTNVAGLPERVRVGFFPLPIDADGAPVRAVAFV